MNNIKLDFVLDSNTWNYLPYLAAYKADFFFY